MARLALNTFNVAARRPATAMVVRARHTHFNRSHTASGVMFLPHVVIFIVPSATRDTVSDAGAAHSAT